MAWCDATTLAEAMAAVVAGTDSYRRAAATQAIEAQRVASNFGDALAECVARLSQHGPTRDNDLRERCDAEGAGGADSARLAAALQLARLIESDGWTNGSFSDKPAVVQSLIAHTQDAETPPKILDAVIRSLGRICALEFPTPEWADLVDNLLPACSARGPHRKAATSFVWCLSNHAHRNVDAWRKLATSAIVQLPDMVLFPSQMSGADSVTLRHELSRVYLACTLTDKLVTRRPSQMSHEEYESLSTPMLLSLGQALLSVDMNGPESLCAALDASVQLPPVSVSLANAMIDPAGEGADTDSCGLQTMFAGVIGAVLRALRNLNHEEAAHALCGWILNALSNLETSGSPILCSLALELLETLQQLLQSSSALRGTIPPSAIAAVCLRASAVLARDRDFYTDTSSVNVDTDEDFFSDELPADELLRCASASLLHDSLNEDANVTGSGWGTLRDVIGSITQLFVEDQCMTNTNLVLQPAVQALQHFITAGQLASRGAHHCISPFLALGMIVDAAKQCNEEGICLLATFDVPSASELLQVICSVIYLQPASTPSAGAAVLVIKCRALACLASMVELTDDLSIIQFATVACENVLRGLSDDAGSMVLSSSALLALGKICGASSVSAETAGAQLRFEHVSAAAASINCSFSTFCALTFARSAISFAPREQCLDQLWEDESVLLSMIQAALHHSADNPVLCNSLTGLLNTIIEEHSAHPSAAACQKVQLLCGLVISAASAEHTTDRLMRVGVECGSLIILSSQSSGGCRCSPHVGDLVRFIAGCAHKGPFDDALTRRVASSVGACATVDFSTALPGTSPRTLVDAAAALVLEAHSSSSAFANGCMAFGASAVALALQEGSQSLAGDFFPYLLHLGGFLMKQATDFAIGGCFLPIAVMIASDPAGTAHAIASACTDEDVRAALRNRQLVTAVLSAWLAVTPHADLRVQTYSVAAWMQWQHAASSGDVSAHFVLCQLGLDAVNSDMAFQRAVVRFKYLTSLHPKAKASDSKSPLGVLRDATPVSLVEGIALAANVLRDSQHFNTIRLASFANHDAFDQLNLTRWTRSPTGLPLPPTAAAAIASGAAGVVLPFLVEHQLQGLYEGFAADLQRIEILRSSEIAPFARPA